MAEGDAPHLVGDPPRPPAAAAPPADATTPRASSVGAAWLAVLVGLLLLSAALLAAAATAAAPQPEYQQVLRPAAAVHSQLAFAAATAAASLRPLRLHSRAAASARPSSSHRAAVSARPSPSGHLMVMSVFEGFSGWLVVLEEAVALAVALNRVLVLPCFRAGKLRPCTPWAPIRGPPVLAHHPAAAAAGPYAAWQTLARQGAAGFPAFAYDCPGNGSELLPAGSADDAFSLDAFFSPAGIDDILARGLARLRSVRGVPLPRRPRGFYRVHTVPFSEWLRATYPGRRITRPLHFNVAAVDLMTNRDCAWEATTSKYFVGDNYVFMGGKLCLGAPGDSTVSGLGYDLGWIAQPHWQAQPLVAVVKWQRLAYAGHEGGAALPAAARQPLCTGARVAAAAPPQHGVLGSAGLDCARHRPLASEAPRGAAPACWRRLQRRPRRRRRVVCRRPVAH